MSGEEHQDRHRVGTTSARTARDDDLLFLYVTKANADFLWARRCVNWARGRHHHQGITHLASQASLQLSHHTDQIRV